jgi:hypothetical protein
MNHIPKPEMFKCFFVHRHSHQQWPFRITTCQSLEVARDFFISNSRYFRWWLVISYPYANHGAGISTKICPKNHPNVGRYSIHGASGLWFSSFFLTNWCFFKFNTFPRTIEWDDSPLDIRQQAPWVTQPGEARPGCITQKQMRKSMVNRSSESIRILWNIFRRTPWWSRSIPFRKRPETENFMWWVLLKKGSPIRISDRRAIHVNWKSVGQDMVFLVPFP